MRTIQLHDDVVTDHGVGFVVGWEAFDNKGNSIELSEVDNGNRVAIRLCAGHSWSFEGLYYEQTKNIYQTAIGYLPFFWLNPYISAKKWSVVQDLPKQTSSQVVEACSFPRQFAPL